MPGTIVWLAPFYNRSGFGVGARTMVSALHRAGVRVRIIPVNNVEAGINDCDMALIESLESTPVVPPITVIVSHVPGRSLLDIKWPEPNVRILATTVFDCCADADSPPAEMLEVCRQMDQLWLHVPGERESFIAAGFPPEMLHTLYWPHHWLENPVLPPPFPETSGPDKPFRFLNISLFLPRRRWDTLIEAYLEEFKETENVELYLKVNYPFWHPVPGKPRQDLYNLIDSLRKKTGSEAAIIIDEDLGTRMGIVRLIDSCNVYISTDTASTAPISEARVRRRMVIIPEGLGLGEIGIRIAVDPDAKTPLTRDMLLYQPNHRGGSMPLLHVRDVRKAMRRAFDMTAGERQATDPHIAHLQGPSDTLPVIIDAINSAWRRKEALAKDTTTGNGLKRITWEGTQLVSHSLALINRELCLQLIDAGYEVSIVPVNEVDNINPDSDPRFEKIVQRSRKPLSGRADVHVRHHWPPNFNPPREGHWVIIQPWEYGRLPESWVQPMATLVDEIWVPSRHVQKTYISSGVPADIVQVVPNGVNSSQFHPSAQKYRINSEKKFKFLFVGVAIWRKGVDLLLDAYQTTFDSNDDVVLVIKDLPAGVFYLDQGAGRIIRKIQQDPKTPEIIHIDTPLEPWKMPGLYTACDCVVHPYRAEGFALPVLEAMACGVPLITTAGGSTDDFCSPDNSYLIPARRVEYNPNDIKLTSGAGWILEPDLNVLKNLMREVFENYGAAKDRALRVSEHVRSNYDWQRIAEKVTARIHAISQRPIRRMAAS